ncbi:hypothetical protein H4R18_003025 [Coemansia javaensis]|uniref:Uncharacterized protein n=1 Tax=Coemansia javaensis TaxID=2761396 RepID=A0A9W8LIC2_9FUNG|nr:hypothetical protein H4R18_003025 [Coemansia javaensis]
MSAYRAHDSRALLEHFVMVPRGLVFFYDEQAANASAIPRDLKPALKTARAHGYQCAFIDVRKISELRAQHGIQSMAGVVAFANGKYAMHLERLDPTVVDSIVSQKPCEDPKASAAEHHYGHAKPMPPLPQYQLQKPNEYDTAPQHHFQKPNEYDTAPQYHFQKPNEYDRPRRGDFSHRYTKPLPKLP